MASPASATAWRRFLRLAAGTVVATAGVLWVFVATVDPWDALPLSPPLDRAPVTSNQRYAYPALARSPQFDSAVFGTSTSRLLRPASLNESFQGQFANLAMNSATPYEQTQLMRVFLRAHPNARTVVLGLDVPWCETGDKRPRFTPRPFPAWIYADNRWRGYGEMLNLYAIQEAGKEFGVLTRIKREDQGRDGYTVFVPPDDRYDAVRAAAHLREDGPASPSGPRDGPPATWRFGAFDDLRPLLEALPPDATMILFFVPYNRIRLPPPEHPAAALWAECKRRAVALAQGLSDRGLGTQGGGGQEVGTQGLGAQGLGTQGLGKGRGRVLVVDFMRRSPITDDDTGYWDAQHYRVGVADRLARDLAGASRGETSADYEVLFARRR